MLPVGDVQISIYRIEYFTFISIRLSYQSSIRSESKISNSNGNGFNVRNVQMNS